MKSLVFLRSRILSYLIYFFHGLDILNLMDSFFHMKLDININGLYIYTSGTIIQLPITLQKKVANITTYALFNTK